MFYIAKLYSLMYVLVARYMGLNIRGLGFVLRQIREDRVIEVHGYRLYFSHIQSEAYGRLISGSWNEPETHSFLWKCIDRLGNVIFIEVGANIGEILVHVASHPNVKHCLAFEPNSQCVSVINMNIQLNHLHNCQVIQKAVGARVGVEKMSFGSHSPTASLLSSISQHGAEIVPLTTLDSEVVLQNDNPVILLIDVEGYETEVLRGAANLIRNKRPLMIFEYNLISKKHFNMGDVRKIIGDGYTIYRLRKDGALDRDVENAWNCVAVPKESVFSDIVNELFNRGNYDLVAYLC